MNFIVDVDEVVDIFVDIGVINLHVAFSYLGHGCHVLFIVHITNTISREFQKITISLHVIYGSHFIDIGML